jgi:type IV pilus assembly protein PilE
MRLFLAGAPVKTRSDSIREKVMIETARRQAGFTLIEAMVTMAILAIIAAIALPSYGDYVKRGAIPDATSGLDQGRIAAEQFFQDKLTYVGAPCPTSTTNFTLSCSGNSASAYKITATGAGRMNGFTYTIDIGVTTANVLTKQTVASPWGTNATCWITKQGGTC